MLQSSIDRSPREVARRALLRLSTLLLLLCALPFLACWSPTLPPPAGSVSRQVPPSGAVLWAPPATVEATMSFEVDQARIEDHWLVVLVAGVAVAGELSVDAGEPRVLVFRPAAPLPRGQSIEAVCDADILSKSGRRLNTSVRWSFFVAAEGATQLAFGDIASVWSGDRPVDLAPLVRTGPGEVGMNFCTRAPDLVWFGAFWSEAGQAWSTLSISPNAQPLTSATSLQTAADGVGGMLCCDLATGATVHHGRDLNALRVDVPAGSLALGRHPGGPTTLWRLGALPVSAPASFDWDAAARQWLPNPSVVATAGSGSLLGALPGDTGHVHKVLTLPAPRVFEMVDLVVVPRDRFGNELAPQVLGRFDEHTVFSLASAEDGCAVIAALEPDIAGTRLSIVEYQPGSGWGSPVTRWQRQGGDLESNTIAVAIASGGAAVVAQCDRSLGSLFVQARDLSRAWGPEVSLAASYGRIGVAVGADGGALAFFHTSTDAWLVGSRPGGPWSWPFRLREVGWLPPAQTEIVQLEVVASGAGAFLVAQSVAAPSPSGPWVLQTGPVVLW